MTIEPPQTGERTEGTRHEPEPSTHRPVLQLGGVTRTFGSETAVDSLSLAVYEGEILTLLGPSGCGKTTTLRLLAGLTRPDAGTISVAGEVVAGDGRFVPPEERDIGLVFQEFALFPHLSVAENIAFGIDDWPAEERETRVDELLDLVSLSGYGDHAPDDLSGGQRQRVALARSLAPEPDVILLDEPFSNLDVALRKEMREEVRNILKTTGVTAVSVTHDQEEALSISDRVAVIHDGHVEQVGRPETVFEHPESRFVAEFLGQAGFLSGELQEGLIETGVDTLHAGMLEGLSKEYDGAAVDVLVRPDDLAATPAGEESTDRAWTDGEGGQWTDDGEPGDGRILTREYTGPSFVYGIELDSGELVHCQHNHAAEFDIGQRVAVDLTADHTLAWFPAE
ncbi:MAG: ABC transporter ATP-binding protein [Halobacteriales archaeon]